MTQSDAHSSAHTNAQLRSRAKRLLEHGNFDHHFRAQFESDLLLALELSRCLTGPRSGEGLLLEALCLHALGDFEAATACLARQSDERGLPQSALVLRSALRLLLELPHSGLTVALRDVYRQGLRVVDASNALPLHVLGAWLLATCRVALTAVDYAYLQSSDELLGRPQLSDPLALPALSKALLERARVALYACEPELMGELLSKVSLVHLCPNGVVLHRVLTLCAAALAGGNEDGNEISNEIGNEDGERGSGLTHTDWAQVTANRTWCSLADLALEYPSVAWPLEVIWLALLVGDSVHAPAVLRARAQFGRDNDGLSLALEFDRLRGDDAFGHCFFDDSSSDHSSSEHGLSSSSEHSASEHGSSADRDALILALGSRFELSEQRGQGSEQWLWGLMLGLVLPPVEAVPHFDALANTLNAWRDADVLLNLGVYIASNDINLAALEHRLSPFAWRSLQRYVFDLRLGAARPLERGDLQLPKLYYLELLTACPQLLGLQADETVQVVALERPFVLTLALVALHGGQMPWAAFEALVAPVVSERAFVYKRGGVTAGERVLSEFEFLELPLLERSGDVVRLRCVSDVDLRGLVFELPAAAVKRLTQMTEQIVQIDRWNSPFGSARFVGHARDVFERSLFEAVSLLLVSMRSNGLLEHCVALERLLLSATNLPLALDQTLN